MADKSSSTSDQPSWASKKQPQLTEIYFTNEYQPTWKSSKPSPSVSKSDLPASTTATTVAANGSSSTDKTKSTESKPNADKPNETKQEEGSLVISSILFFSQASLAGYYSSLIITDPISAVSIISKKNSSMLELFQAIVLPYWASAYSSQGMDSLTKEVTATLFSFGLKDIFQMISTSKYGKDKAPASAFEEEFIIAVLLSTSHLQTFLHLLRFDFGVDLKGNVASSFTKSFCIVAGLIFGVLRGNKKFIRS